MTLGSDDGQPSYRDIMAYGAGYLRGLSMSNRPLDERDRDQLRQLSDALARHTGSNVEARHDYVYHSRELELEPQELAGLKAVHVVIRNQAEVSTPGEMMVILETTRGSIPVPIVRAHSNEPQPKGDA